MGRNGETVRWPLVSGAFDIIMEVGQGERVFLVIRRGLTARRFAIDPIKEPGVIARWGRAIGPREWSPRKDWPEGFTLWEQIKEGESITFLAGSRRDYIGGVQKPSMIGFMPDTSKFLIAWKKYLEAMKAQ